MIQHSKFQGFGTTATPVISMIAQLVAIVALVSMADGVPISFTVQHSSIMIASSDSKFALSDPQLLKMDWKTLTVMGDNVTIWRPSCARIERTMDELSKAEQSLVAAVKFRLNGGQDSFQPTTSIIMRSSPVIVNRPSFNIGGNGNVIDNSNSVTGSSYQANDLGNNIKINKRANLSIESYGKQDFSIAKGDLPDGIVKLSMNSGVVSLVYNDGRISMKPASCMSDQERQLIEQLRAEYNL